MTDPQEHPQEHKSQKTAQALSPFVDIAVPSSSPGLLTYETETPAETVPGSLVEIDVRGKPKVGVVIARVPQPSYACKPVLGFLWGRPQIPGPLLNLLLWVSQYYLCPLPRLIHVCAPGALWKAGATATRTKRYETKEVKKETKKEKAQKNLRAPKPEAEIKPALASHLRGERPSLEQRTIALAPEQQRAVDAILGYPENSTGEATPQPRIAFRTTLLEGITGSGKTEVYLSCAQAVLAAGRNVLVLVPEIALTPQMTMRFRAHFGEALAVVHSGLTGLEVEREWYRIALGQARIVLGVRRGVFAPLQNLGLIIVDEEHDASYKSDEYPCVHSRDVAIKRAQLEDALCVLGSASPSLETRRNADIGLYAHLKLKERQRGAQPQIEIFDSRPFFRTLKSHGGESKTQGSRKSLERSTDLSFQGALILPQIVHEIAECKRRGEQSMIIVNRRGFANFALCMDCGEAQKCPHCEVTTTLHKHGTLEICHHCGFKVTARTHCVSCNGTALESRGFGTQRVENELTKSLPDLRIDRLDRDVMTSPTRLSELLNRFRSGESDALIGTQILSKGHDFPKVSLVAILHLEDSLFLPDFRSAERTFQLLLQSAGRAGRGEVPGRVVVQSLQPEHPVLHAVQSNQSERFYRDEISLRNLAGLPPFARQILCLLENRDEIALSRDAYAMKRLLDEHLHTWRTTFHTGQSGQTGQNAAQGTSLQAPGPRPGSGPKPSAPKGDVRIIGPHPAPVERLGGWFRAQILLSLPKTVVPRAVVPTSLLGDRWGSSRLRIDVDPQSFL